MSLFARGLTSMRVVLQKEKKCTKIRAVHASRFFGLLVQRIMRLIGCSCCSRSFLRNSTRFFFFFFRQVVASFKRVRNSGAISRRQIALKSRPAYPNDFFNSARQKSHV